MGKVLGIDFGSKRVGLATGEDDFGIAFPRDVIQNKGIPLLITSISDICEELDVSKIVVGLPLNPEAVDSENKIMTLVRKFVEELGGKIDIPVFLFDEMFSSFEADEFIREAKERGDKTILGRDAYAAQVILQRFFDKSST